MKMPHLFILLPEQITLRHGTSTFLKQTFLILLKAHIIEHLNFAKMHLVFEVDNDVYFKILKINLKFNI